MRLRKKTLIIFSLTLIALTILVHVFTTYILLGSFTALEEYDISQKVNQAESLFENDISNMDNTVRDWAFWDDSHRFMEDGNLDYLQSNMEDTTYESLKVNFMVYVNSSGHIVYSKAYDLNAQEEIPVPKGLVDCIYNDDALLCDDEDSRVSGFIVLQDMPTSVIARPILKSDMTGPPAGTLIMGRFFDDKKINDLSRIVHLSVNMYTLGASDLPEDYKDAISGIDHDKPIHVNIPSSDRVYGYKVMDDIHGFPAIVLSVDASRPIYDQGQEANIFFLITITSVCLVLGLVMMFMIEKTVLSRLDALSKSVNEITARGNNSARVSIPGDDELSELAGNINGMLGSLNRSKDSLQKSELMYRSLFQNMLNGFSYNRILLDEIGRPYDSIFIDTNEAFEKIMGRNKQDIIGKKASEVFPGIKDETFDWIGTYGKVALTGKGISFTAYSESLERWLSVTAYSTELYHFVTIIQDITISKISETAIMESEERYRGLVEMSPDMIAICGEEKIKFINHAGAKLLGCSSPDEIIGKSMFDFIRPVDKIKCNVMMKNLKEDMTPIQSIEEKLERADGSTIDVEISATPFYYQDIPVIQIIVRDITGRKRAEEHIKRSLTEKEVLLKEIHHRVKNNLQIISSLLNLQSNNIADKSTRDMFIESQNRIKSMALLHERLYQSKDLSKISFREYVISLVSHLFRSYKINSGDISINVDVDDVYLSIDTAIPCGLIINELVSNSLKHAFPDDRKGDVAVKLHFDGEHYRLMVKDNGIGLPKDINIQNSRSLGLQLVYTLTDQLDGKIEFFNGIGTEFRIEFKETKYKNQPHEDC
ncbi:hypothetical protein CUJ83_10535 [Methanocella sp. CWC-04]|uniref:histidine kinase n=1 Tax=Methanooceanicella nereidis TaxID=2052831 RepID=A0AAP2RG14_9EURY|nr:CHASE4 domain-containing protein [Methanocella sp. CWC-04]MCD1295435.1 hypothetical protein [Methanocella sp. CWC-04]